MSAAVAVSGVAVVTIHVGASGVVVAALTAVGVVVVAVPVTVIVVSADVAVGVEAIAVGAVVVAVGVASARVPVAIAVDENKVVGVKLAVVVASCGCSSCNGARSDIRSCGMLWVSDHG